MSKNEGMNLEGVAEMCQENGWTFRVGLERDGRYTGHICYAKDGPVYLGMWAYGSNPREALNRAFALVRQVQPPPMPSAKMTT